MIRTEVSRFQAWLFTFVRQLLRITYASVTKQYNLVSSTGWWCSAAEMVRLKLRRV